MNKFRTFFLLFTVFALILGACGCAGPVQPDPTDANQPTVGEFVDYVAALTLDKSFNSAKLEVTVKTFVDGDTVHFHVPTTVHETGVLKGRFLGINTPESTGKIEEYGKAASKFTREKLSKATSIIIESENETWNHDSTGDRYLVWVWYKTETDSEYRNLNLEILQNGLAIANSAASNRYGSLCMSALNQAKAHKLNLFSGKADPDFYYGDAVELTLKELRSNPETYSGVKVAFNGVITRNYNNSVYVEAFDPETGMYHGISVYYGFALPGAALDILSVGNEVRIVGLMQFYEAGGTWQISGLTHNLMKPQDPGNCQMFSEGNKPAYVLTDAPVFASGKVTLENGETRDYAEMALGSSLEMRGLTVESIYTTEDEESSSKGAMTLTCKVGDTTVSVRTIVLKDANGNIITADTYEGKTIDVKGIVDFFDGNYQIKVFSANDITIHN
jgi:micrococcal nuclease